MPPRQPQIVQARDPFGHWKRRRRDNGYSVVASRDDVGVGA
jgi:hypothetical protein